MFVVVANNSAGSLAQPAIGVAFDAGPADVGWVVFGFSVAFSLATAVWGGLARWMGLGPALATGTAIFAVGSLAAAVAPSLGILVAARVVQGLGAGAIPTLSAALIARRYDGIDRSRALGTIVAAVGAGLAAGPLVGGVALEAFGWQGPVALGVIAAPAALLLAREDPARDRTMPLDLVGAVIIAIALLALTFSLNRLPILGIVPITAIAVVVASAATALVVRRSARPNTFLPARIVRDPVFVRVVGVGMVGMGAFFGSLILVPVAAAGAHGLTGISLGLVLMPMAIVAALSSLNNAGVQTRLGTRRTTELSLLSLAVGAGFLAVLGPGAAPWATALALAPLGLGFGLLGPPLLNEITVRFDGADRGIAVGAYYLGFFMGGAIGASVSTAFVQAGIELAPFAGRPVAGFSTSEALLTVGPLVAIVVLRARVGRVGTVLAR